jgi:hypothetical protein
MIAHPANRTYEQPNFDGFPRLGASNRRASMGGTPARRPDGARVALGALPVSPYLDD